MNDRMDERWTKWVDERMHEVDESVGLGEGDGWRGTEVDEWKRNKVNDTTIWCLIRIQWIRKKI